MASSQIQRPAKWWHTWSGLLITLAVVLVFETLTYMRILSGPGAIYFLAVAYASFSGGRRAGVASAVVAVVALSIRLSEEGRLFSYTSANLTSLALFGISMFLLALLVGLLKESADQYLQVQRAKDALEAEMLQRQRVETDHQRAESEKDALSSLIQQQRERLNSIVASVPGVVWEAWGQPDAANQRIDFVSSYVETMLGYTTREWLSTPNFWLTIVHLDDKERAAKEAADIFTSGKDGVSQFRWLTRDGRVLWVEARSSVTLDAGGEPLGMRGVNVDITERKRTEDIQRFRIEASMLLSSSLDYEVTLGHVARMAVPDMADWCGVELVKDDGSLEQVAVAHVDPVKVAWAKELRQKSPPDPTITDRGLFHVLKTGASEFYPLITDAMLEESARTAEEYQLLRDIGFTSVMIVPLEARGRILGALTFVSAEGKRQYDQTDLTLAEELGRRAGLAVDNARLYREAQAARVAAEAAQGRLRFLAEASTTLSATLDYEGTLKSLAQLVIANMADWCGIDAPGNNGEFRRLAGVHRNPEKQQLIEQMRQRFHVSPDAPITYPFVLRTGQSELIPDIPAEIISANTPDPETLEIVQRINMRSTLCVPLIVRGEVFAALSMGISESGRRYNETDLALAQELARRAAIAIDIAWLYAEAQREIERRTEVENDLRRSEEQLRLVTNSLPVLISYVDSSYRYRFTNYAYREWFGLLSEEIYGKTMTELVGEAVFERVRPYVERALDGEGVTYEALLPYARGARYVSVSYVPRRNEAGIVVGFYALVNDISERKRAEEEIRQRNEIIEIVSRVGQRMSAELDLQNLVQIVTDAATELTGAEFGAFFYNLIDERGESYTLYTISGIPREKFSRFPMPRNTKVFAPTFDGEGIIRLDDVRKDPRYGQNDPYFGMPEGHLPVVSYLAVPVLSRSGKVLGGLFFGHQEAAVFTEREEGLVAGLAAQAAIGMDNASLFLEAQEQRQHLQVTLSSIGDAVIATDTSGRVTFMNAVAHEITAWGSEAIGEKLETVFHIINEASREIVENPVIKVLREGMIVGLANHTLLVAKDGREIPIDDSGAPIRNEDGQLVGVILVFRDIGERRLIDNLLRSTLERTQELYEISQRIGSAHTIEDVLKALLNSSYLEPASRAALLAFDRTWSDIPPESYELLALAPQEASPFEYVGMRVPLRDEFMLFTRDEPTVITDIDSSTIDHYTRSQLAQFGTRSFITFPLVAGGKWYGMLQLHFLQRHSLTEEDTRYIRGLVDQAAVAIDNIRLLEAEAKARRAAEKADELKLKFLAMISHELRTPLTSIKGFATTLLAEDVQWDAGSERDFLEIISTESDKLTDLIEQLLDLSRLEAGTLRILAESQSVQSIFAATNMQLESVTPEHRLSFDLADDLPLVLADRQRIGQVLTNLAGNAAKFAPEGTTITISARRSDNEGLQNSAATMVRIDVSDEGMGIPISERELVFEAFQQVVEHSQNKGAGLGLAICRGLIEAHGGRIWIQDREGPGTTVSFTLPIALHIADTDEMNAAGK